MTISTLTSPPSTEQSNVGLSEVVAAMSYALDITEGQPEGHAARSCLIAMKIAEIVGLSAANQSELFYGTLLKDAGCSSNAAKVCSLFQADDRAVKRKMKTTEWTSKARAFGFLLQNAAPRQSIIGRATTIAKLASSSDNQATDLIRTRCSRGADIARKFGFDESTAAVIQSLDEHYDGHGEPNGLVAHQIPLLARIACLAQTMEVYHAEYGSDAAIAVANRRSGSWFDPELVQAATSLEHNAEFWQSLTCENVEVLVSRVEPQRYQITADEARLDSLAEGFADVVDAKSPWTYRHSENVADVAVGALATLGYNYQEQRYWRRAALLHDIGKLSVSNLILDKPGRLSDKEFDQVKQHTVHTYRILNRVSAFRGFAEVAAAHHERLDGKGYHLGLTASQIPTEARVMAVADVYDALSAKRPYRERQLDPDEVFAIIDRDAGSHLCPRAIEAVKAYVGYDG